jgi:RHS repeat-associated protein
VWQPGAFDNNGGDRLVLRERDLDGDPLGVFEERVCFLQNARGDVVAVYSAGDGGDNKRVLLERVRYTEYGEPMCYAAADVNLDGRVDGSDESAWLALLQMGGMNPVTGEPDRRMDLNGDGEVTQADFALWGPLFEQACKRPNEVGAMVDDAPFNGVAEGGVLTVPTRSGTYATGGGTWVMHGVDNRFGFAGYMWDPFLKLYHVRHRVYDPMGGRWLQRDPIGMAGGWNLYQYCGGEPWGMVDPMGLDWENPSGFKHGKKGTWHHYYREDTQFYMGFIPVGTVRTLVPEQTSFTPAGDFMDDKNRTQKMRDFALIGAMASTAQQVGGATFEAGLFIVMFAVPGPEILAAKGLEFLVGKTLVKEGGVWYTVADGVKTALKGDEVAKAEAAAARGEIKAVAAEASAGTKAADAAACGATVGSSSSKNYRATFFAAHPELEGKVIVHHAVEQQVLKEFPGLFTEAEIHSLQNLRGIPKEINSNVHLSQIRTEWNAFYRDVGKNGGYPTREQVLQKASEIDQKFNLRP